jgi:hypothetical protein
MSQASDSARKRAKPKGLKNPATLISLIAVTAVTLIAAIVILHDAQVSSEWDNSYKAIGAAISKKKVSRQAIQKYIQGSPTREYDKKNGRDVFTWSGFLFSYRFQVEYDTYGDVTRIKQE